MLHKLLMLVCILNVTVYAQDNAKSASQAVVDYTKIGAPMPDLRVAIFHDTTTRKDTTAYHGSIRATSLKKAAAYRKLKQITGDDLKSKRNLFIMMFNPNCSHCEDVATSIHANIGLFEKNTIVLLANPAMTIYIPGFLRTCQMENQTETYVGTDESGFVDHVFLYQALPQINIYNAQRKLIRTFTGDVLIDSLKKYAN